MSDATASPVQAAPEAVNRLENFPVSFFAVVMGFSGLTLALHAMETNLELHLGLSFAAYLVTIAAFVVVAAFYLAKVVTHWGAVVHEWHHPIRLSFFPAITISLLLLAIITLGYSKPAANILWLVGMAGQGVLTIAVVSSWIGTRSFVHGHLNPAWFIPAVGNVLVPVAGAPLGYLEISWYFMAVGLFFWIVLITLVLNRLIFHDPIPGKLQPTLVIMIAPPAVSFIAWMRLHNGVLDDFAMILLNLTYLFALIVAVQLPKILKLPFGLPFWALSFPIAAFSIASFAYSHASGSVFHRGLGLLGLGILLAVIAILIVKTLQAIAAKTICVPE